MRLVRFRHKRGSPVAINPKFVVSVYVEHSGRVNVETREDVEDLHPNYDFDYVVRALEGKEDNENRKVTVDE